MSTLYIHKLKLSMNYSDQNITVTPLAEEMSKFTRKISDTIDLVYLDNTVYT